MVQHANNEKLSEGLGYYQAGRLDEARTVYWEIIQEQPHQVEAIAMLGIIAHQTGAYDRAIGYYQEALAIKPDYPEAYNNLGASFWEQGQMERAVAVYKQAIAIKPDYIDAYNNLAIALSRQGKISEATAVYQQVVLLRPESGEARQKLADLLKKGRRWDEAMANYQQAIALNPENPELYNSLGEVLKEKGEITHAKENFQRAIGLKPDYYEALNNLAFVFVAEKQLERAAELFQQMIALKPQIPETYNNLGATLKQLDRVEEAIACYEKALALKPEFREVYNNLGAARQEQALNQLPEAIANYRTCIAIDPEDAMAHSRLGMALLLSGNFPEGWVEYEWRWQTADLLSSRLKTTKPVWDGRELAGKTILLDSEQGFGDTIQFIRYVPLVAKGGGKVIVQTYTGLQRLFATVPGIDRVIIKGEELPEFDCHAPLMSLPHILGTRKETIPSQVPYLQTETLKCLLRTPETLKCLLRTPETLKCLLRTPETLKCLLRTQKLRVGIAWTVNPQSATAYKRACPLSYFLELLEEIPEITLYSLEVSDEAKQEIEKTPIQDLSHLLKDFADTAAVISQLDLVISVDTAVAHLAGALGKIVWVLLPFSPDWRWQLHGEETPWYPTMRLFRQAKRSCWSELFDRVKVALGSQTDNQTSALLQMAQKHEQAGNVDAAAQIYRDILSSHPRQTQTLHYLGCLVHKQGLLQEAIDLYQRAIAIDPHYVDVYNNLALAFTTVRQLPTAIEYYNQALRLDPENASGHLGKGLALLLMGDMGRGFVEYEWRFAVQHQGKGVPPRLFQQPTWQGEPLGGRTILLYGEQGYGDAIQFIRYAPLVAQRGGRVIVECHSSLVRLFATVSGIERIIAEGTVLPDFDLQAPLMSLPRILCTTLETIPNQVPYLKISGTLLSPIPRNSQFKIGFVWSGHIAYRGDITHLRAYPVGYFLELAQIPEVTLYSLQKYPSAAEIAALEKNNVLSLHDRLSDFADTAAIINQLDLVISVDTAVAHLAGALGKPVWVLLPFAPDWRWMLDRSDSPWYPTMRLFRQEQPKDWQRRFADVKIALRELLSMANNSKNTVKINESLVKAHSLYQGGEGDKAIALCRQLLLTYPGHSETTYLLGVFLQNTGKIAEAIGVYRQAIARQPQDMRLHNNLGVALRSLGRDDEAIACYEQAITIDPNCGEAYHNLAIILEAQDRREEAIAYYEKTIAIKPEKAEFYNRLGYCYQQGGDLAEAARRYQEALRIKPDYLEAICNLGITLQRQGNIVEAIAQYRQALAIKPDYPEVYNNMGTAWESQGKLPEAIGCHQQAIALKPDFAEAYSDLGFALQGQKQFQQAAGYYRHAIALKPDEVMAHVRLGMCLLLLQDFQRGFAEYEWRWRTKSQTPAERLGKPLWDGSSLAGKTILLHTEQGCGDAIQFVRYAPLVAQQGTQVILETYRDLGRLFTTVPGVQQVVIKGEQLPAFDLQAPLMSLPRILGTTVETIPAEVPYLHAEGTEALKCLLRTEGEVKVGIVWAVNAKSPTASKRSCPVSLFLELLEIPGISLYSLQKEHADILDGTAIQDLSTHLHDFADTAAAIAQLDLVISVDTAVAHLAGALGKPVWVLLPFSPDWRWLLDRSDSPWYPTMRLFRQAKQSDWQSVFAQVKAALTAKDESSVRRTGVSPVTGESNEQQPKTQVISIDRGLEIARNHHELGQTQQAIDICRQILSSFPAHADTLYSLGSFLHRKDNLDEAIALYQQAIASDPNHFEARLNLGLAICQQGDKEKAIAIYQEALSIQPDRAEIYYNLGNALQEQEKYEEAMANYQQAIARKPDYPKAYNNWGNCLKTVGRLDEAIAQYRQAIALDPNYAGAYNRLGNTFKKQGKIAEAIAQYHLALAIEPHYVEVHNNMALVLQTEGRLEEAIGHYNKSLQLRPDDATTHFARAFTWLLMGEMLAGWNEYEWRWDDDIVAPRHFEEPLWDGSPGGTILIYTEQGLGDNIQFIRYAPLVKERVGQVIVECPESLVRLFANVPGIDRVVSQGKPLPEFDVQVPLMSLPRILGTSLENIPAPIPYLWDPPQPPLERGGLLTPPSPQQDPPQPPLERGGLLTPPFLRGAGGDLPDDAGIKVGFVWAGTDSYLHDLTRYRSCPLDLFLELLAIPNLSLYSLQKEPVEEALKRLLRTSVVSLHEELGDFADTANAIAQLDLIISVDTAVAHLAGAMGKPVWVLLPFAPDWRWMLNRSDSPWYPTMHLFRQSQPGDWQGLFAQVKSALQSLVHLLSGNIAVDNDRTLINDGQLAIALAHHQGGRLEAAENIYRQIIANQPETAPDHPQALHLLGVMAHQKGQSDMACDLIKKAIALNPNQGEFHSNLTAVYHGLQQLDLAMAHARQAINLAPEFAEGYYNLAAILRDSGDPDGAISNYRTALRLQPDNIEAARNLAATLKEQGKLDEAIGSYQQVVSLDAQDPEDHFNLGVTLQQQGRHEEAIAQYRTAIELKPDYADAYHNIGVALQQTGKPEQAIAYYEKAIELLPEYIDAYNNMGHGFYELRRIAEAIGAYSKTLELDPENVEAHFARSLTLLYANNFPDGFAEYHWRWHLPGKEMPAFPQPLWQGEDLTGLTILLHAEQGLGDTIQFIRYVSLVAQRHPRAIACACGPSLLRLFSTIPGISKLISVVDQSVEFDVHAPLMSLPGILGTTVSTIPTQIPYLQTVENVTVQMPKTRNLKVGIVWAAGEWGENRLQSPQRLRSCGLNYFLELLDIPGIVFYSLQKGTRAVEATDTPIHDLSPQLNDFADTASAIAQLDLVISVDTAVPHLAGALGKPVWMLLPFAPDWRWMQSGESTPWYSTMRLFRQASPGDWQGVFEEVWDSLLALVNPEEGEAVKKRKKQQKAKNKGFGTQFKPPTKTTAFPGDRQGTTGVNNSALQLLDQGFQAQQSGKLDAAIACYSKAISIEPEFAEAHRRLGMARKKQGKLQEATQHYRRAINLKPDLFDAYINLGVVLRKQGLSQEAIATYEQALQINPNAANVLNNLGNVYRDLGRVDEAASSYQRAISIQPNYVDPIISLGSIFQEQDKLEDAIAMYDRAIAMEPNSASVRSNLGVALKDVGRLDDAKTHLQEAIALDPNYAIGYSNLGLVLEEMDQLDEAEAMSRKAIALDPNFTDAYHNLAVALHRKCQLQASIASYERAIDLNPQFAEAHMGLAITLMLAGDYRRGFVEYEWRWQLKHIQRSELTQPDWQGESLDGKTILLYTEQGFGDTINFIRYAPLVRARGTNVKVIVMCKPAVYRLLQTVDGIDQVIIKGEELPQFDVKAALLSLPRILGTTWETIPTTVPYVKAVPWEALTEEEALKRLLRTDRLKVGIAWAGNPANKNDRRRSTSLSYFQQLLSIPGIAFYSLQKGDRTADITPEIGNLANLDPLLKDFADTAAIVRQLDLVITVDTAVAHLAGALGKPVWVLLCHCPDWRWRLTCENSPWYPTMRLFRQQQPGDWSELFARVKSALLSWSGESSVAPVGTGSATSDSTEEARSQAGAWERGRLLQTENDITSLLQAGVQHQQGGRLEAARNIYQQILQAQPLHVDARQLLGVVAYQMDNAEEAIAHYRQALALNPNYPEVLNNLGAALWKLEKAAEAIPYYQKAIALKPDYIDAYNNLGQALMREDRMDEAISAYQQLLSLKPDHAEAHVNLGLAWRERGNLHQAIGHYQQALARQPKNPEARLYLAIALLLNGDFGRGFVEYEWRWHQKGFSLGHYLHNVWDGSPLEGKTILLRGEQGFGDAIQFIRYLPMVRARKPSRIVVECQQPLIRLFQTLEGIDQLVVKGEPLPPLDLQAPLMSLPRILGTTLETIPHEIPYFHAVESEALKRLLRTSSRIKVGIVWAGSTMNKTDRHRSITLDCFLPLLQMDDVSFYSLQKGDRVADITQDIPNLVNLDPQINDFADTAAIVEQLDLVITVDTAVAHLAGALGKPVWVLLAFAPDWRWMLERPDSPWYPTMRLFRQQQRGDWSFVFAAVKDALQSFDRNHKP
ncbi:MAG: tetratricopeptide repeat protein [Hormoscilla sp.]